MKYYKGIHYVTTTYNTDTSIVPVPTTLKLNNDNTTIEILKLKGTPTIRRSTIPVSLLDNDKRPTWTEITKDEFQTDYEQTLKQITNT